MMMRLFNQESENQQSTMPFRCLLSSLAELLCLMENPRMEHLDDEEFDDEQIPIVSGRGEVMEETPAAGAGAGRRNEDIALDLMKFVAMTTGYGRTTSTGVGFQGTGSAAKPEEYADRLLELYAKCLSAVENAK
jgi:hypothetical protein